MRRAKVERENKVSGFDEQFHALIRDNDESLPRCYPLYINVTDAFIIKVLA